MGARFSISMPVRGQAELLPTALKSILAQSSSVELAVLDASPDDDAQRVLRHYPVPIAYAYHHPDGGQAVAIQDGWDHTTGDVVAWLNADDYYVPDALARVDEVFRLRPDVDVVYGYGVHVTLEGDFATYFPAIDPDPSRLLRLCVVCQPACFVRRRAMERVGGLNTGLQYTMDWEFWVRLFRAGAVFSFLDEPLAAVRIHPATKTLSGGRARAREIDQLLRSTGTPWWRRLETRLAFYRYDLRYRRRGPREALLHGILGALARRRRRLRRDERIVNGLECWTNQVRSECLVVLPWYRDRRPEQVTITTNRPLPLSLEVNGTPLRVEPEGTGSTSFLGDRVEGHVFRARLPPVTGSRLTFGLGAPGPWRLLDLRVA